MNTPEQIAAVTLEEQIACVKRELGFRARVYPSLVRNGRMSQADMEKEKLHMRAVLATLEKLAEPTADMFSQ